MKKTIVITLVAFLTISSTAQAQLMRGYGIKGGAVSSNQSWHSVNSSTNLPTSDRWGFTLAGFLEFLNFPFLSSLLEAQYTQKGMIVTLPLVSVAEPYDPPLYATYRPRIDYLSILLLLKLRPPIDLVRPYVIVGPRLDLYILERDDRFYFNTHQFEPSDFGLVMGIGIELEHPIPILVEFRYNPNYSDSLVDNFNSVRNRSRDFLVGFRF